ncbi:MAG: dTDP-4-amino-4,6-dideoxygalactose transaminase [Elusimicrobia bacterium]|nr:dTDP-4-amino-4,6-dideoxygalactose transaminase [Elusimicrobiota bacterium]
MTGRSPDRSLRVPFNKPSFAGKELQYIEDAVRSGHISGDGKYTERCQAVLEAWYQGSKVLLTTSCTDALEMAALLLDLRPGDEIIVPSFTFVSTVNAFVLSGARPRFVDIRPDTLNLDEGQVERHLTSRTKAIVPVHYAGVGCAMDRIMETARRHGIAVVEDNAHGLFGICAGKPLGMFGALAALSFHETKNVICGEGGAIVINDRRLVERAEVVRAKGTNRSRFDRGEVAKYEWIDSGSSFLPSDILAAFLLAQLEAKDRIQAKRRGLWDAYRRSLAGWAQEHGVGLPTVPEQCEQAYHMFYLLLPSPAHRDGLKAYLGSRGCLSVFHYSPLHVSPMGRQFGGREGDCPVAEDVSRRLLRLPFYTGMTDEEQAVVLDAVLEYAWG